MSDIAEMVCHRILYVYLQKGSTQLFCQIAGIVVGSVRSPEARHCDADNLIPGKPQQIKGPDRDKQRQGGIESAGNTDYRTPASRML